MSRTGSLICTTIYTELLTVIDIFRCKNCGREYAEVSDIFDGYKRCPYCGAEVGEDDAS